MLELWVHFHDHMILIELRVDRGDLALAEGVVQGVVNVRGENAEPRGGIAVNDDFEKQPTTQIVAGNIAKLRKRFQSLEELRDVGVEFFGVHIFKTVLKLRAADAVFDRKILHRLHKERDAVHFVELRLKPANDVAGANVMAQFERFEIDLNAALC